MLIFIKMNKLSKHENFLKFLNANDDKVRKSLLKHANPQQKKILIEIVSNTLNGNVPLTSKQKNNLKKYKTKLRKLCLTCTKSHKIININSKRGKNALNQIGGALPFLIAPLLALIGKAALGGIASAGAGYATKKIIDTATK